MKRKIVTAFMMAALGSSLVFSQAVMAIDTTAKTETSEDADKDSTESEDKDVAEDADKADEEKDVQMFYSFTSWRFPHNKYGTIIKMKI